MKTLPRPGLTVRIISPFMTYYDGPAVSVSALNETGPFDILVDHAKFFSVLLPGELRVDTGEREQSYPLDRGIIRVADNTVTVFANV